MEQFWNINGQEGERVGLETICFPVENLLKTFAQQIYLGATQLFDLIYFPCMGNSCFSHSKKKKSDFLFFLFSFIKITLIPLYQDEILMGHVNMEYLQGIHFCCTNMPGMLKEFSPKPLFFLCGSALGKLTALVMVSDHPQFFFFKLLSLFKCESWWIEHWLHYDHVSRSYNLFLTGCLLCCFYMASL